MDGRGLKEQPPKMNPPDILKLSMVSGHLATRLVPSRYLCVFGVREDSYFSFVPSHETPRAST